MRIYCATIFIQNRSANRNMIRIFVNRLVAICIIGFISVTSMVMFPIALMIWLMTARFDKQLQLLHQFTCLWASLYLWLYPLWSVEIINREKIDPNKTYVIVSNHRSLVDILVAFTCSRISNGFRDLNFLSCR